MSTICFEILIFDKSPIFFFSDFTIEIIHIFNFFNSRMFCLLALSALPSHFQLKILNIKQVFIHLSAVNMVHQWKQQNSPHQLAKYRPFLPASQCHVTQLLWQHNGINRLLPYFINCGSAVGSDLCTIMLTACVVVGCHNPKNYRSTCKYFQSASNYVTMTQLTSVI